MEGKREWPSRRKVTTLSWKRHTRAWKESLINPQNSSQDSNDDKENNNTHSIRCIPNQMKYFIFISIC